MMLTLAQTQQLVRDMIWNSPHGTSTNALADAIASDLHALFTAQIEKLKEYRPQHHADCAVHDCRECGQLMVLHGWPKPIDECVGVSKSCTCGLDAFLAPAPEQTET